ncbi:DUF74-domain-containing protein [Aaosphaeria arxii CBS 175.79]|uniref:DUF74-domain-containing protein n=1 Tax=Aaosphaeria arxii CBS 175.79 TaxID=1450172 RepID=A0A6A5Y950_9PLEO|nr:DUF74-domain-containing protein [Aaosphaeria arxii CBS 175.79]KAF2021114.1 DUF74-domain-containing protein [Aaosphaeria arxii CBS 175.79]
MLTNRRSTMMIPPPTTHKRTQSFTAASPNYESEPHCRTSSVLTATTDNLPGHRVVKVIGTVHGITTCARKETKTFLKSMGMGSEAKSLTHMLYNARDQAIERMVRDCVSRGGNAIVGIGFGESEVLGFAQVSVYGTAVFVERQFSKDDPFNQ